MLRAYLTDVIGITVGKTDAHILVEQVLQVEPEVGEDEVTSSLEGIVVGIVTRVIQSHTESLLD